MTDLVSEPPTRPPCPAPGSDVKSFELYAQYCQTQLAEMDQQYHTLSTSLDRWRTSESEVSRLRWALGERDAECLRLHELLREARVQYLAARDDVELLRMEGDRLRELEKTDRVKIAQLLHMTCPHNEDLTFVRDRWPSDTLPPTRTRIQPLADRAARLADGAGGSPGIAGGWEALVREERQRHTRDMEAFHEDLKGTTAQLTADIQRLSQRNETLEGELHNLSKHWLEYCGGARQRERLLTSALAESQKDCEVQRVAHANRVEEMEIRFEECWSERKGQDTTSVARLRKVAQQRDDQMHQLTHQLIATKQDCDEKTGAMRANVKRMQQQLKRLRRFRIDNLRGLESEVGLLAQRLQRAEKRLYFMSCTGRLPEGAWMEEGEREGVDMMDRKESQVVDQALLLTPQIPAASLGARGPGKRRKASQGNVPSGPKHPHAKSVCCGHPR